MNPSLLSTTALQPLSRKEVAEVLDGLVKNIEKRPCMVTDPVWQGTVRLALAAAGASPLPPAPPLPAPVGISPLVQEDVPDLDQMIRSLLTVMREQGIAVDHNKLHALRLRLDELAPPPLTVNADQQHVRVLELERDRLKGQAKELERSLAESKRAEQEGGRLLKTIQDELRNLETENTRLRGDFSKSQGEVLKSQDDLSKALKVRAAQDAEVLTLQRNLAETSDQCKKVSKSVETALAVARTREWSLASNYTYRDTGKKIMSCPVCGGLDPTRLAKDKDSGHRKACWLGDIVRALSS